MRSRWVRLPPGADRGLCLICFIVFLCLRLARAGEEGKQAGQLALARGLPVVAPRLTRLVSEPVLGGLAQVLLVQGEGHVVRRGVVHVGHQGAPFW